MRKLCEVCDIKTVNLHSISGQLLHVCLNETCSNYQVFIEEEKEE